MARHNKNCKPCSKCGKLLSLSHFSKDSRTSDGLRSSCKECYSAYYVEYSLKNKEVLSTRRKKYRGSPAKYYSFYNKLTIDETPVLSNDGVSLEVKCKYCGRYFVPKNEQVFGRIRSLNGKCRGDNFLYCSNFCKSSCSTYGQNKYYKGFKKITAREVQPELRKLVLERDNWMCQICHKFVDETALHCHHITGVELNPIESADIDNCITLCKEHHAMVHKLPGCGFNDLVRKTCNASEENDV